MTSGSFCRIVDDIRFVLRHPEVTQYVARERLDLYKAWLHLLAYIQGMDSQRRQTNIHIEEETESWFVAYLVELQMASIHSLLIEGASKTACKTVMDEKMAHQMTDISCRENPKGEDIDHGHAKIGRISKDSDVSGKVETSGSCKVNSDRRIHVDVSTSGKVSFQTSSVPSALLWLIAECARILEVWLLLDAYRTTKVDWPTLQKESAHQRTPALRRRGGRAHLLCSAKLIFITVMRWDTVTLPIEKAMVVGEIGIPIVLHHSTASMIGATHTSLLIIKAMLLSRMERGFWNLVNGIGFSRFRC